MCLELAPKLTFRLITIHSPVIRLKHHFTCPQADAIKAIGEQVVAHAIGAPVEAAPRVGYKALSVAPAEAYVWCQVWDGLHVVHDDLVVPALVHGRTDAVGSVDVGVHAAIEGHRS